MYVAGTGSVFFEMIFVELFSETFVSVDTIKNTFLTFFITNN